MVRIFLRELLRAILCWVEATLRDFARKSAIKFNSVQQYSSDFERIQIRSLKILRVLFCWSISANTESLQLEPLQRSVNIEFSD
jgi:hypothetical protein